MTSITSGTASDGSACVVRQVQQRPGERRSDAQMDVAIAREGPSDLVYPLLEGSEGVEPVLCLKARGLQDRTRSREPRRDQSLVR